MLITSKLEIDLQQPGFKKVAYAVQNDSNTRALEISLFLGGAEWEIPSGTTAAVSFRKMDLTSGLYDTLPDGSTKAVTFSGNTLTAVLAPQVLTCAGKVDVSIALYDADLNRLGVFPVLLYVSSDPSAGKSISNNYYYLSTLAAVNEAIGDLSQLQTTDKSSLVAAINEATKTGGNGKNVSITAERFENSVNSGVEITVTTEHPDGSVDDEIVFVYDGKDGAAAGPTPDGDSSQNVELDTTLTQSGKAADAKAVGDKIAEITGITLVEPADDDIPKVFFGGALQQTKDEAVVPFRYISKTQDFSGCAEIKAQGNTSMTFPKKNQTVKLFKDAACTEKLKVDFKGWGKQNKHVYKANWIDISHARNVVSARLWADVVKSRANYAELPELLRTTPNQGAVDGFPVKVYAAGIYQGRYTLNIPKDKWTFNMDDDLDEHCALCGENYASGCFRASAKIDESDWTDEIHDAVPASIKTRWNEVISVVMNSTDEEFRANLNQYFYVDSLIDYYLFGLASCGLDAFGKNQIYMTYDGQRWIASMYDMDATWGLYWNGSQIVSAEYPRTSYEDWKNAGGNLLYIRLEQLFSTELLNRWAELKKGALSIENIINRFERFTDIAPAELVKEDYASTTGGGKFTGIPSKDTNNIQQIRSFALARQAWTDSYLAGIVPAIPVPCTGITLNKSALTFNGAGTQTITATVTPDGCTDAIVWAIDNTSIATVVDGVVTATANGNATITARCGNYSATCSISVSGIVEPVPCTGISLSETALTFTDKDVQTKTIVATVAPADTTDAVVWISDNESVATVVGGVVTIHTLYGTATITATCGNYSASCSITVDIPDESLVYRLPDVTTFDGTNFVDTGVQLFAEDKPFTVCIDWIHTGECVFEPGKHVVAHCMKENSPYPGLTVMYSTGRIEAKIIQSANVNAGINSGVIGEQAHFRAVLTKGTDGTGCARATANGANYVEQTSALTYVQFPQTLILGAYQDTSGNKGRYAKGILADCKVYNRAFTEDEAKAYLMP